MMIMTGSILLTAATRWEADPVAKALGLSSADGIRHEGQASSGTPLLLIKTGIGRDNAARALADIHEARVVVSTGFCGALQPGMRSGDLVADLRGIETPWVEAAREAASAQGVKLHFGKIADSAVVCGPAEKALIAAKERAAAVDMETAAVRRWADAAKVPVLAIRAVLDEAGDRLPAPPAGEEIDKLARYVLSNILSLPLLAATGLRQRRAAAALAGFLSRFLEAL